MKGDIDLLPDALRSSYGKYESAWEEAMSMRSSGLCHPDDIREQTDIMNGNYKEFREGLREFLGLDKANDASFVREQPTYPNKDWNEQLLAGQKQEETVDETRGERTVTGRGTTNTLSPMMTDAPTGHFKASCCNRTPDSSSSTSCPQSYCAVQHGCTVAWRDCL